MAEWNFGDVFEAVAAAIPDAPAIVDGERVFSWGEFDERSAALAAELLSTDLPVQAKVAVYLRNSAEFLESYNAVLKSRFVPVNVNYRYGADELEYLLEDSDTEIVIVHAEFAELVRVIAPRLANVRRWYLVGGVPDVLHELAGPAVFLDYEAQVNARRSRPLSGMARSGSDLLLIYTGGTTGMPKGVMWRQTDLFEALVPTSRTAFGIPAMATVADLVESIVQPGPRGLSASPMMHGTGLLQQFVMLLSGGTAVILNSRRFDARHLWQTVTENKVTAMVIVGDAFARPMLDVLDAEPDAFDLSALGVISSSGAIWSRSSKEGMLRHLPWITVWDTLASGEGFGVATSVATSDGLEETGQFVLGDHVRVRQADGSLLAPGEAGSGVVLVKGALPLGYYKDPEKTAATFRTIDGVRYSMSGDFVEVLANGRVQFLGRGSGCINTGGEKVFVEEVEEILHNHPAVADAACVGAPDDRFGAIVCAVVKFRPHAELRQEDLSAYVKEHLAAYKAPRRLVVVDEVPRTVQGKPDYPRLAELVSDEVAV